MTPVLKTFLSGLIDYAGLFPPAQESMATAVAKYAAYRGGEFAFALGPFIVPVTRLDEFAIAASPLVHGSAWPVSALAGPDLAADVAAIGRFNQVHAGQLEVVAVEAKAADVETLRRGVALTTGAPAAFFEIPLSEDPSPFLELLSGAGGRAKIRTGGITADAFPRAEQVTRFLTVAARLQVPFKATAGLHHPVRAVHPLTYEPGSARALMHGFLNLFLCAAFLREGMPKPEALRLLEEESPQAFRFHDDAVEWRESRLDSSRIAEARSRFALSFGSCSFEEPIADLGKLNLI